MPTGPIEGPTHLHHHCTAPPLCWAWRAYPAPGAHPARHRRLRPRARCAACRQTWQRRTRIGAHAHRCLPRWRYRWALTQGSHSCPGNTLEELRRTGAHAYCTLKKKRDVRESTLGKTTAFTAGPSGYAELSERPCSARERSEFYDLSTYTTLFLPAPRRRSFSIHAITPSSTAT